MSSQNTTTKVSDFEVVAKKMYTIVDGPTLSLLLYSHLNSKGKQMGFILGQKMEKVERGITDSQIHTAQVHSYIYVTSFIPWPRHKSLYGRNGHIDEGLMNELLENSDQHVVGWYSFRQETSQIPSMKEVSIHSQLTHVSKYDRHPEDFVFFLCTSTASKNMSTHSSDHAFMVYRNEQFVNIPMTVKNLGDTSRMDYVIHNSSPSSSKVVHANLGNSEKKFVSSSGEVKQVAQMKSLISSMSTGLESTQTKVNNSEAILRLLEGEVAALRDRVAILEREEMQRAFDKAERQKRKEEEERIRKEKNQEAEEEEQMNKLLLDLGLARPAENDALQHEQNGVQIQVPTVVSLPKLEAGVNPLYVSTLSEFEGPDPGFVNFNIQGKSQEVSNHQKRGIMQFMNTSETSSSNSKVGETEMSTSVSKSKVGETDMSASLSKNKIVEPEMSILDDPRQSLSVHKKPKDPFDFVTEEVKLELTLKPRRQIDDNLGTSLESNRAYSSKLASCHQDNKTTDQASYHRKLETRKADNLSNSNGHVIDPEQADEHDGPISSDPLLDVVHLDDVTISSSPVF